MTMHTDRMGFEVENALFSLEKEFISYESASYVNP